VLVTIVGAGRMGTEYAAVLSRAGIETRLVEPADLGAAEPPAGVYLLALFDGSASHAALQRIEAGARVVDLTTQAVDDAGRNAALAAARAIRYWGGGVTGGAAQVGTDAFSMAVGPDSVPDDVRGLLAHRGGIVPFDSPQAGATAKLLHNLVLIVNNYMIGWALAEAERRGLSGFAAILDRGTAGRPARASSAFRDFTAAPASSYTGALVEKDLRAVERLIAGGPPLPVDLAAMGARFGACRRAPHGLVTAMLWCPCLPAAGSMSSTGAIASAGTALSGSASSSRTSGRQRPPRWR